MSARRGTAMSAKGGIPKGGSPDAATFGIAVGGCTKHARSGISADARTGTLTGYQTKTQTKTQTQTKTVPEALRVANDNNNGPPRMYPPDDPHRLSILDEVHRGS